MEASALRELAEKRYDDFVDALREMVNVDCGSFTPDGVNAIADLCQARFVADALDLPPAALEPRLAQVGDRVHPVGRVRPAIDVNHLAERVDEVVVPLLGEVPEFGRFHRTGVPPSRCSRAAHPIARFRRE